jgi:hypothetical protein
MMKEEFLHFIWKHRLFEPENTFTAEGEPVEIVNTGRYNIHAGPDFFDARIRIGKTLWAGNVEIHFRASDWNRHRHHLDPQYRNTILHVVAENDEPVKNDAGSFIPAMVIGWSARMEYNYKDLICQHDWVNCASHLNKIDPFRIRFFLNGLAIERIQHKIGKAREQLDNSKNDWSETFYRLLCRSLGYRQNGDPFEMLARSLPLTTLKRHHNSLFQLEALLFGQAGFLNSPDLAEEYPLTLLREYKFLAAKYALKPISRFLWKFMRMHPLNFPTVRMAQLAGILHRPDSLFSLILHSTDVSEYRELFRSETSQFWDNHFTFKKLSPDQRKRMGEESFQLILINVVVPFLFLYGEQHGKQDLKDRALKLMEDLPPEDNTILRHWESSGIRACNALESQALIHLHHEYCELQRCLECTIGQKVVMHNQ